MIRFLCLAAILALATPALAADDAVLVRAKAWRESHEKQIVEDYVSLLSMPNVATDVAAVQRNADFIAKALQARGFKTRLLAAAPDTPPAVFGELRAPGAKRTIVFYAHYDGQPVSQPDWRSDPFRPVMRGAGPATANTLDIDWRAAPKLDPDWRLYARSASDDKAHVEAMLAALDALKGAGATPQVNIKVFYEGEEEQGSHHLAAILKKYPSLLKGDFLLLCDGPRHQTGKPLLVFGVRGSGTVDLTVYGPLRPLHDGHYGNWAPNPSVMLVHLLASLRDENGHVTVPGFYDDVRPLTEIERKAYAALPDIDAGLKKELALGRTESMEPLPLSLTQPALNLRGIRVGDVGDKAANVISTEAQASIDFRFVPDQKPEHVRDAFEAYLASQGWFVVQDAPDAVTRAAHPKVVRLDWSLDYRAYRTDLDTTIARALETRIAEATGGRVIKMPMLGGSVPMALFADALHMPVIGLASVNYDNNQHAANENIRLRDFWETIDIYAGLLTQR